MINPDTDTKYISASELSDFVFCKRGWWLSQNNLLDKDQNALDLGNTKHEAMYQDVTSYDKFKFKIILIVIFFIIVYIIFGIYIL